MLAERRTACQDATAIRSPAQRRTGTQLLEGERRSARVERRAKEGKGIFGGTEEQRCDLFDYRYPSLGTCQRTTYSVEREALLARLTGRGCGIGDFDLLLAGILEVSQAVQYHPLLRKCHAAEQQQVLNALQKHCSQFSF